MSPLKVVLADDHSAVRRSLRLLLESERDIDVVAETNNGPETIRVVQNLQPDLLLLDIKMPQMSGLEVLQYLRNGKQPVAIIILSNHVDQLYVAAALRLGANAFVSKSAGVETLLEAIQIVRQRAPGNRAEHREFTVEPSLPRGGPLQAETRGDRDPNQQEWAEAG